MTGHEVIVAGGGIGGLSAALALSRKGLRVRVLEKAGEFGEIGYGIQLAPNAYRILQWLGIEDEVASTAVYPRKLVLVDALTDKELAYISLGDGYRAQFLAPYIVTHRRDLHGALLKACRSRENIALETAKEVSKFEDTGQATIVTCADGSQYPALALIGADGLWSNVRRHLLNDGPPRATGHFSFRGTVSRDQAAPSPYEDCMTVWIGLNLHMVQYRVRGGTVVNNVATIVSPAFKAGATEYGDAEELLRTFAPTCGSVHEMLGHVDKSRGWMLYDRDPAPGWSRGRVTLLGDAAHPTLQYMAQGACMAIEDAVVVAQKLADANGDVPAALLAYEKERYLRTARVQVSARIFGEIIHCGGGARDVRNHLLEQRPEGSWQEVAWVHRAIDLVH
jgi:salicylate hydroxylase